MTYVCKNCYKVYTRIDRQRERRLEEQQKQRDDAKTARMAPPSFTYRTEPKSKTRGSKEVTTTTKKRRKRGGRLGETKAERRARRLKQREEEAKKIPIKSTVEDFQQAVPVGGQRSRKKWGQRERVRRRANDVTQVDVQKRQRRRGRGVRKAQSRNSRYVVNTISVLKDTDNLSFLLFFLLPVISIVHYSGIELHFSLSHAWLFLVVIV